MKTAQSIGGSGYLEHAPGIEPKRDKSGNQRQEDSFVLSIKRDVDEDV